MNRYYDKHVRYPMGLKCPLCHFPSILTDEAVVLKIDERIRSKCPVCGLPSTAKLIRELKRERVRIEKVVKHAKATKRPFPRIALPGVVILPNGNYFSTHAGMR